MKVEKTQKVKFLCLVLLALLLFFSGLLLTSNIFIGRSLGYSYSENLIVMNSISDYVYVQPDNEVYEMINHSDVEYNSEFDGVDYQHYSFTDNDELYGYSEHVLVDRDFKQTLGEIGDNTCYEEAVIDGEFVDNATEDIRDYNSSIQFNLNETITIDSVFGHYGGNYSWRYENVGDSCDFMGNDNVTVRYSWDGDASDYFKTEDYTDEYNKTAHYYHAYTANTSVMYFLMANDYYNSEGSYELRFKMSNTDEVYLYGQDTEGVSNGFAIRFYNNLFQYYTGTTYATVSAMTATNWNTVRVDYDVTSPAVSGDLFNLSLNGVQVATNLYRSGNVGTDNISRFCFYGLYSKYNKHIYIDSIGFYDIDEKDLWNSTMFLNSTNATFISDEISLGDSYSFNNIAINATTFDNATIDVFFASDIDGYTEWYEYSSISSENLFNVTDSYKVKILMNTTKTMDVPEFVNWTLYYNESNYYERHNISNMLSIDMLTRFVWYDNDTTTYFVLNLISRLFYVNTTNLYLVTLAYYAVNGYVSDYGMNVFYEWYNVTSSSYDNLMLSHQMKRINNASCSSYQYVPSVILQTYDSSSFFFDGVYLEELDLGSSYYCAETSEIIYPMQWTVSGRIYRNFYEEEGTTIGLLFRNGTYLEGGTWYIDGTGTQHLIGYNISIDELNVHPDGIEDYGGYLKYNINSSSFNKTYYTNSLVLLYNPSLNFYENNANTLFFQLNGYVEELPDIPDDEDDDDDEIPDIPEIHLPISYFVWFFWCPLIDFPYITSGDDSYMIELPVIIWNSNEYQEFALEDYVMFEIQFPTMLIEWGLLPFYAYFIEYEPSSNPYDYLQNTLSYIGVSLVNVVWISLQFCLYLLVSTLSLVLYVVFLTLALLWNVLVYFLVIAGLYLISLFGTIVQNLSNLFAGIIAFFITLIIWACSGGTADFWELYEVVWYALWMIFETMQYALAYLVLNFWYFIPVILYYVLLLFLTKIRRMFLYSQVNNPKVHNNLNMFWKYYSFPARMILKGLEYIKNLIANWI